MGGAWRIPGGAGSKGPKATSAHTQAISVPGDHDPWANVPLGAPAPSLASKLVTKPSSVLPDTQPVQIQMAELRRGFLWRKPQARRQDRFQICLSEGTDGSDKAACGQAATWDAERAGRQRNWQKVRGKFFCAGSRSLNAHNRPASKERRPRGFYSVHLLSPS